uniref:NAD(P)-binding domain-containing protein n=1 Tax=Chromera velia CCMP2878 TaxID=1169474 RepID=A0A0G4HHU3_9ALVE|eukprot:Cvel_27713.t1-p1 / transcript=Cvel_27713.t1 / gene=Cvel_27713 / organism=Chromera_velia_CCMP2878 / gene_product=hypothetical protein / transcript_product=hypothetical protein / location=Cvel_scaffold3502:397-2391(-) / protein_length=314 / sequence_SO=supercontig / SO=protein_coding / is_pseudo=false
MTTFLPYKVLLYGARTPLGFLAARQLYVSSLCKEVAVYGPGLDFLRVSEGPSGAKFFSVEDVSSTPDSVHQSLKQKSKETSLPTVAVVLPDVAEALNDANFSATDEVRRFISVCELLGVRHTSLVLPSSLLGPSASLGGSVADLFRTQKGCERLSIFRPGFMTLKEPPELLTERMKSSQDPESKVPVHHEIPELKQPLTATLLEGLTIAWTAAFLPKMSPRRPVDALDLVTAVRLNIEQCECSPDADSEKGTATGGRQDSASEAATEAGEGGGGEGGSAAGTTSDKGKAKEVGPAVETLEYEDLLQILGKTHKA